MKLTKKAKAALAPVVPVDAPLIKLDFGCGRNKQAGFTGVDFYEPDADIKLDLFANKVVGGKVVMDWKDTWKDDSVDEIFASHFVEHIPGKLRWPFFEACWRILKVGGTMKIVVPSWKSERSIGDMTHEWPPVSAMAFYYLHKGWRESNKLTYGPYDIKCNFDHNAGPTAMSPSFTNRSHEAQVFAATHYLESYSDMWVTLTKRPM